MKNVLSEPTESLRAEASTMDSEHTYSQARSQLPQGRIASSVRAVLPSTIHQMPFAAWLKESVLCKLFPSGQCYLFNEQYIYKPASTAWSQFPEHTVCGLCSVWHVNGPRDGGMGGGVWVYANRWSSMQRNVF
jgi:hypothetical protein